jgi:hypothetical protein
MSLTWVPGENREKRGIEIFKSKMSEIFLELMNEVNHEIWKPQIIGKLLLSKLDRSYEMAKHFKSKTFLNN